MKLDNSNKSYSNVIAGILAISVFCILLAFFMGFGGNDNFGLNRGQTGLLVGNEYYVPEYDLGSNKDVPVPQCYYLGRFDTAVGSIAIGNSYFNPLSGDEVIIPLTFELNDLIDGIEVSTVGDYEPLSGTLKIRQKKAGYEVIYWVTLSWGLSMEDVDLNLDGVLEDVWLGTFVQIYEDGGDGVFGGDDIDVTTAMTLASNHVPDCSKILNKWVYVSI